MVRPSMLPRRKNQTSTYHPLVFVTCNCRYILKIYACSLGEITCHHCISRHGLALIAHTSYSHASFVISSCISPIYTLGERVRRIFSVRHLGPERSTSTGTGARTRTASGLRANGARHSFLHLWRRHSEHDPIAYRPDRNYVV